MSSIATKALSTMGVATLKDCPAMIRFVDAIASAFENTLLARSFSAEIESQGSGHYTRNIDKACMLQYVDGIRASAKDECSLVEVGELSAVPV